MLILFQKLRRSCLCRVTPTWSCTISHMVDSNLIFPINAPKGFCAYAFIVIRVFLEAGHVKVKLASWDKLGGVPTLS